MISTFMEFTNMDTTTILPTPPTSGAIVQSSGSGYDNGLSDLILSNNIADNSRAILTTVANGNAAIIAADQNGHLINQKATGDASVANITATNLNGVSNIEATNRNGLANITSTERNAGEIRMNVAKEAGESRLATAIGSSESRELIRETSTDNLIAIKDNGFAIREEGCKTREVIFAESCKTREILGQKLWDLEKETLKGLADNKYSTLETKCALSAQIAKCCAENELLVAKQSAETRALILSESARKCEAENQELRTRLMILSGGLLDAKIGGK